MSKVKTFACTLAIILTASVAAWAYTFDITVPVKGKTATSEQLQQDSLFTIYSFAIRAAEPDCKMFSIENTVVSKPKKDGNWEEIWTLKACKRTVEVPISFTDNTYSIDPMKVRNTINK